MCTQFSDAFTGTSLGLNWRVAFGAFSESGGAARGTAHDTYAVWAGTPAADSTVTATLGAATAGTYAGVIARANTAEPEIDQYAAYVDPSNTVGLGRRNDWSYTTLATGPVVGSGAHTLGLTVSGSGPVKLSVTLDGATVITFTDSSPEALATGSAGIFDFEGASRPFEDFSVAASCTPPPPVVCGDSVCSPGQACDNGVCLPLGCGNDVCDAGEDCITCPLDCPCVVDVCGNGFCEFGNRETCASCSVDCGSCPPATCGDGLCFPQETCVDCPFDCGICVCGNDTCDPGETCANCANDCGLCVPPT
jgi:hypothetical protein